MLLPPQFPRAAPASCPGQGVSDSNENQTSSYMAVALSSGARSRFRCTDRVRQAPVVSGSTSVTDVSDAPRQGINHAGIRGLNSNPDSVWVTSAANAVWGVGRQGNIIRAPGRSASSQCPGGATTPAFT